MRKAVFFDIDGTLWDFYNHIPESTVTAIRKLRENGNYAFICSGRARAYIQHPDLFAIGFDGVVAGCGTHVELNGDPDYQAWIDSGGMAPFPVFLIGLYVTITFYERSIIKWQGPKKPKN